MFNSEKLNYVHPNWKKIGNLKLPVCLDVNSSSFLFFTKGLECIFQSPIDCFWAIRWRTDGRTDKRTYFVFISFPVCFYSSPFPSFFSSSLHGDLFSPVAPSPPLSLVILDPSYDLFIFSSPLCRCGGAGGLHFSLIRERERNQIDRRRRRSLWCFLISPEKPLFYIFSGFLLPVSKAQSFFWQGRLLLLLLN